jgi:dTDP-4-amino-4,6-dideoxygalactose transaminase
MTSGPASYFIDWSGNDMNVPMLDLQAQLQTIRDELRQAVVDVVESTCYTSGPRIEEFEARIAQFLGAGRAIGVSSGTDALLVSLMALGVGPGDLVLTTPFSFFATAGVIARLYATPVFVDIDPQTFNLDPQALKQWFDGNPGELERVKAIIPVHLFGQCADMDAILAIAREHNVAVIEDAAQALGSSYPSKDGLKRAGVMGDAGCFSFYPTKNLGALGDAGMVATTDAALGDKIAKMRTHGSYPADKYRHGIIGGNFRIDAIQAAALGVKLNYLDAWNAKRRENAAYYDEHLHAGALKSPALAYGREHHIYHQYVLRVAERRDELKAFLTESGIGCAVFYPLPFHLQECFAALGYKAGDFPQSEQAAQEALALPIYPELTREMQDCVIEKIVGFVG